MSGKVEVGDNSNAKHPHIPHVDRSKIESDDLFTRLGEKLSDNFMAPLLTLPPSTPTMISAMTTQSTTSQPHSQRNSYSVWSPEDNNAVQTSHLEQLMNDMQTRLHDILGDEDTPLPAAHVHPHANHHTAHAPPPVPELKLPNRSSTPNRLSMTSIPKPTSSAVSKVQSPSASKSRSTTPTGAAASSASGNKSPSSRTPIKEVKGVSNNATRAKSPASTRGASSGANSSFFRDDVSVGSMGTTASRKSVSTVKSTATTTSRLSKPTTASAASTASTSRTSVASKPTTSTTAAVTPQKNTSGVTPSRASTTSTTAPKAGPCAVSTTSVSAAINRGSTLSTPNKAMSTPNKAASTPSSRSSISTPSATTKAVPMSASKSSSTATATAQLAKATPQRPTTAASSLPASATKRDSSATRLGARKSISDDASVGSASSTTRPRSTSASSTASSRLSNTSSVRLSTTSGVTAMGVVNKPPPINTAATSSASSISSRSRTPTTLTKSTTPTNTTATRSPSANATTRSTSASTTARRSSVSSVSSTAATASSASNPSRSNSVGATSRRPSTSSVASSAAGDKPVTPTVRSVRGGTSFYQLKSPTSDPSSLFPERATTATTSTPTSASASTLSISCDDDAGNKTEESAKSLPTLHSAASSNELTRSMTPTSYARAMHRATSDYAIPRAKLMLNSGELSININNHVFKVPDNMPSPSNYKGKHQDGNDAMVYIPSCAKQVVIGPSQVYMPALTHSSQTAIKAIYNNAAMSAETSTASVAQLMRINRPTSPSPPKKPPTPSNRSIPNVPSPPLVEESPTISQRNARMRSSSIRLNHGSSLLALPRGASVASAIFMPVDDNASPPSEDEDEDEVVVVVATADE